MSDVKDGSDAGVADAQGKQQWVEPQLDVVPLAEAMKTGGGPFDSGFQYS